MRPARRRSPRSLGRESFRARIARRASGTRRRKTPPSWRTARRRDASAHPQGRRSSPTAQRRETPAQLRSARLAPMRPRSASVSSKATARAISTPSQAMELPVRPRTQRAVGLEEEPAGTQKRIAEHEADAAQHRQRGQPFEGAARILAVGDRNAADHSPDGGTLHEVATPDRERTPGSTACGGRNGGTRRQRRERSARPAAAAPGSRMPAGTPHTPSGRPQIARHR